MFQNDASVFLHVWCWWCLSETNRLTDISLAKIDSESAENCILGSATMSQMQLPTWQEENAFRERKKKSWEDCSKQRVLSFSLAESLPGKKSRLSSSCWVLLLSQGVRAPPSGLLTLFNWGFCLPHFYKANIFLLFLMYAFLISLSKFELGCVLSMNST